MQPRPTIELRVAQRNLRWEVSCNGVTRRMIDWLCTKERAIAHAFERADELMQCDGDPEIVVIVERSDGTEEQRHAIDGAERSRQAS